MAGNRLRPGGPLTVRLAVRERIPLRPLPVRAEQFPPDHFDDIILAIDPFTKWVEIGTVPTLNSHEVAEWFHREVVCRYGVPARVQTDKGREYCGEFDRYLRSNGIGHSLIATNNPRANG